VKLILDNLGRIGHADIEIRPLTVFVGENNTNKTWAAYCLWDLVRRAMVATPSGVDDDPLPIEPKDVGEAIGASVAREVKVCPAGFIYDRTIARQDLISGVHSTVTFHLSSADIAKLLHASFSEATSARAALVVEREEFCAEASVMHLAIDAASIPRAFKARYSGPGIPVGFEYQWPPRDDHEMPVQFTKLFTKLAHGFIGRAMLLTLPAERKALVQAYPLLLREGGAAQSGPVLLGNVMRAPGLDKYMSWPSIHFMKFLKTVEGSYGKIDNPPKFPDVLQHLERNILGGSVTYEPGGEFRLAFSRTGRGDAESTLAPPKSTGPGRSIPSSSSTGRSPCPRTWRSSRACRRSRSRRSATTRRCGTWPCA
jgi:hypothetical protein